MSNGNQRLRPNAQSNTTRDPLISPVTLSEFSDFLGLDYDSSQQSLLESHLLAACGWYIAHSNNELLSRSYNLKFDRYPSGESFGGLGPAYARYDAWIDFPLAPVESIVDVTSGGDTVSFTSDLDSKPARLFTDACSQEISIDYIAGYETASDIPASVLLGIKMMAAYLYEHRGSCSVGDAAKDSGAMSVFGFNAMILSL